MCHLVISRVTADSEVQIAGLSPAGPQATGPAAPACGGPAAPPESRPVGVITDVLDRGSLSGGRRNIIFVDLIPKFLTRGGDVHTYATRKKTAMTNH